MRLFLHWIVSAIAIIITAFIVPGAYISLGGALILAVVLGALNLILRPILFILTLPVTIVTLGLFSLVINALLVLLAGAIVPGFAVAGFWSALLFSIVLTIVHFVFHVWSLD